MVLSISKAESNLISALLVALILALSLPPRIRAQTDSIRLERIIYLTGNLDSLTRSFEKLHLKVIRGKFQLLGLNENRIELPCGQIITIQQSTAFDTTDWHKAAQIKYGTHVSGISFQVKDVDSLASIFDHAGISHSQVAPHQNGGRSIGISNPKPLDVTFVSYDRSHEALRSQSEGLQRITWLVLTASPDEEALIRNVFKALDLRMLHEGCCDYWLIGPGEDRIGIRFEIPNASTPRPKDWLSIEPGGMILNY